MESNTVHFNNRLNQYFGENNIKFCYISESNIIIVSKEDKVYEFNKNATNNSLLIFSDANNIIEQKCNESLLSELCNNGIIEFKKSFHHTIARTYDGKLYCWGYNYSGVLGNGEDDCDVYKPKLNGFLNNKQIIEMSCGERHSIVLTINGEVYGWGLNSEGQIGNRKLYGDKSQLRPYFVDEFNGEKVKSISCGYWHSLALTHSGRLYIWGCNKSKYLCRENGKEFQSNYPMLIELKKEIYIQRISCGEYHSLFLSREGDIYVFGSNEDRELGINTESAEQLVPIKLNNSHKFKEIASHPKFSFSAALSINGLYYIWGKVNEVVIREPKVTQFKSFNQIFLNYFGISCCKPINVKLSYELIHNFIQNGFHDKDFNRKIKKCLFRESAASKIDDNINHHF